MIRPFIEPNEFLQNANFQLTAFELDLTSDGWLRIHVRWKIEGDKDWMVKYPVESTKTYVSNLCSIQLTFPGFGKDPEFETLDAAYIEIGLQNLNPESKRLEWDYKFKENIKYGVNLYFAPKDWNIGPDTPIWYCDAEKDEEVAYKEID